MRARRMRVPVLISDHAPPSLPIHAVVVILNCLMSTPQREEDDRMYASRDTDSEVHLRG